MTFLGFYISFLAFRAEKFIYSPQKLHFLNDDTRYRLWRLFLPIPIPI